MLSLKHTFESYVGVKKNCNKGYKKGDSGKGTTVRKDGKINVMDYNRGSKGVYLNNCQKERMAKHRRMYMTKDGKTNYALRAPGNGDASMAFRLPSRPAKRSCLATLMTPRPTITFLPSLPFILISLLVSSGCVSSTAGTIHDAARAGDIAQVKKLLEEDAACLETRDAAGMTALHIAARGVHADVVRFLVERGADVNTRDANGVTPLHSVTYRGEESLTAFLVARGADVNAKLTGGQAPLHFAVQGGFTGIADLLMKNGADPDVRDLLGNTPLLLAASHGQEEPARRLVAQGTDLNARNERGTTPLGAAVREGHIAMARLLEEAGARPDAGETAPLRGAYLGQNPPGSMPALFAPGVVSTEQHQLNAVFMPSGDTFYFSVRRPETGFTILETRIAGGSWTRPRAAPFSGRYSDVDHFISGDGERLLFCSDRPVEEGGPRKGDHDLWFMERTGNRWGPPRHMGSVVNSDRNDFYPTLTADGTLYFSSHRAGGLGENDIYSSRLVEGAYAEPENLGPAINTEFREFDPFIAPDGSYLIFASERPGGLGASDLHISFRTAGGTWTPARNMGEPLNSAAQDLCPMLSPDGKHLFLTSRRAGVSDIYWVDARVIGRYMPRQDDD